MGSSRPRPPLPPGPYLIVGLARSGQAAASLLARRGEDVIAVDSSAPPGTEGVAALGVEISLDDDGLGQLPRAGCLVKSPGVPAEAPVVAAARERGVPVVGELELAWRLMENAFVAVTGTNGKTTVAEVLGDVWRSAGRPVAVAGNVGTPLASLVDETPDETTIVCETSSFQLEDSDAFAPECALLLNVSPDHLDRHGTFERYLEAKLRIFANQGNDDVAVYNGCDPALRDRDLGGCARRVAFCRDCDGPACEVVLDGGAIVAAGDPLIELADLHLIGPHNAENAMAATAAALAMGLDRGDIAAGLRSFPGVAHRLEPLGERNGVTYVNDSKATNVAAARAAIESFAGGLHVILGGSSKGERFGDLAEPLAQRARAAYLVGATASELEADLARAWERGVARARYEGVADAVAAAAAAARAGDVVLLAPACASFDAYPDYAARGEHFRELVEALP